MQWRVDHHEVDLVPVWRVRCVACRRIYQVQPQFVQPRRRYAWNVVQRVLEGRHLERLSFRELEARFELGSATLRDWCRSFASVAPVRLQRLSSWAVQLLRGFLPPSTGWLEPAGSVLSWWACAQTWLAAAANTSSPNLAQTLETLWLRASQLSWGELLPPTRSRAGPAP